MAARAETVERHRRALRRRSTVSEVPRPHAVAPSRTAPAKRLPDPLDQILDFGRQLVGAISPQAIAATSPSESSAGRAVAAGASATSAAAATSRGLLNEPMFRSLNALSASR